MSVPIGTILPYGGNVKDPATADELKKQCWLVCDGSSYDKGDENYQELFDLIGYDFGKDEDKFRVPDLRGRFVRGVDYEAGRDPDADKRTSENDGNSGDRVGSVQDGNFQEHTHMQRSLQRYGDADKWKFKKSGGARRADNGIHGDNEQHMYHIYTNDAPKAVFPNCSSGGKETRPKNIYVNWIIKAR